MTAVPPPPQDPGGRHVINPLVLADLNAAPPAAARALIRDKDDRRLLLVELRFIAGVTADHTRQRFLKFFRQVFRADEVQRPEPVGRLYVRCALTPSQVQQLVQADAASATGPLIYHVWPDLVVDAHLDRSVTTIKADAAVRTYRCGGARVWAVLDSGIDGTHPHFTANATLCADNVKSLHKDFTLSTSPVAARDPLVDTVGHGTHVAGIIAGHSPEDQQTLRIGPISPPWKVCRSGPREPCRPERACPGWRRKPA